jgi:hypothetical protein
MTRKRTYRILKKTNGVYYIQRKFLGIWFNADRYGDYIFLGLTLPCFSTNAEQINRLLDEIINNRENELIREENELIREEHV